MRESKGLDAARQLLLSTNSREPASRAWLPALTARGEPNIFAVYLGSVLLVPSFHLPRKAAGSFVGALLLVAACDRGSLGSHGGSKTGATFDTHGLLSGPGAPDRSACVTDADCVVADIPTNRSPAPPPHLAGCCPASGHEPQSRKFFDWVRAFQAAHCPTDRAECPDLPPPAAPAPCVHEPRCVSQRCTNACGQRP